MNSAHRLLRGPYTKWEIRIHKGRTLVPAAVLTLAALFSDLPLLADDPPPPGTVITVAGSGRAGFSGDNGPAVEATFNTPWVLAVDLEENLLIADAYNGRVRKVGPDGTITTIVGGGQTSPRAAVGGPATQARLGFLFGLAVDPEGNVFIGDHLNNFIWRMSPGGALGIVAGNGSPGFSGDNGPATMARFDGPGSAVIDSRGNLVFADLLNNRIRRVQPDGTITTIVGGGNPADGLGDGGPATAARLRYPYSVAIDREDNLFIADFLNHRIRKVTPEGVISTVAGAGKSGFSGDNGPAVEAQLSGPTGVAVDPGGNLFIADNRNARIRKVSPSGTITTLAGTGRFGFSGEGGPASAASLSGPWGVALDRKGSLYFSDGGPINSWGINFERQLSHSVRKVIGVAVPE